MQELLLAVLALVRITGIQGRDNALATHYPEVGAIGM